MVGIVIQQYEQQHTPQGAMLPTDVARPGAALGEAVAGLGRAVSGFAGNMDQIADRKAKVESARMLAEAELTLQEGLMTGADGLGETDPTGFAGTFNEGATKVREKLMEKAGDNPYLAGHLKLGYEELQRRAFVSAMKVEREATGKFVSRQVTDLAGANVKLAINDPSRVAELIAKTTEQIDAAVGVNTEWRAESKVKAASAIAEGAISSLTKTDPVRAAEILADQKHVITASLSADRYDDLYDKAQGASIDYRGRIAGGAIAAKAFASGGLVAMDKALSGIKDEQVRMVAEKYAKAEYTMLDMQKNEIDQNRKKQAYDLATDAANKGIPFKPPAGLGSYETQQAVEYYQALVEQKAYQAKGGALTTNQEYLDELQAMMFAEDKTAFLRHNINETMLSARDYRTAKTTQARMTGGRTTSVSDVGAEVDRAMLENGYGKNEMNNKRASVWKMVALDMIAQREAETGIPVGVDERKKIIRESLGTVIGEDGWFQSAKKAPSAIDPKIATIISRGMVNTAIPITSERMFAIQQDIEANADKLDDTLEANGIPVTPQARAELYMLGYSEQYKRQ